MIRKKSRLIFLFSGLVFLFALLIFFVRSQPKPLPLASDRADLTKINPPNEKMAAPEVPVTPVSQPGPTPSAPIITSESFSAEKIAELRSLAKSNLATVYGGQKAFLAEYGRYTSDLLATGFAPESLEMNFKMGFLSPQKLSENAKKTEFAEDLRRTDTDAFLGETNQANESYRYSPTAEPIDLSRYSHLCRRGCTVDDKGFELLLALPIGSTGKVDVWLITSDKEITLVQDGLQTIK